MSTQGSLAGLETFDNLNFEYEKAYEDNDIKKSSIAAAISMLPSNSRILDVGCGTGVPVSDMLAKAGHSVVGFDISPKMIALAQARVKGSFSISDMLSYDLDGKDQFTGVFMIFAHLQLSYASFHSAVYKYASVLPPCGILALGQMPSDLYVTVESCYDETKAYVEDYDVPFMGEMLPTFMMSAWGQRTFLTSMGLEIVWEKIETFHPRNEKCVPEVQQYIIARRSDGKSLHPPMPLPNSESVRQLSPTHEV
jgi:SAM-dependent methyltransferase